MYGTQTEEEQYFLTHQFENDVKMYGTQTTSIILTVNFLFENDVKMYGTQTVFIFHMFLLCLRMM